MPAGAALVLPRAAAPAVRVPVPVVPAAPAAAVAADPSAELASAWQVFASDGLTEAGRYDQALKISALLAGDPVPASISTQNGRNARLAALRTELELTRDPRERGRLAGQLSKLSRGEVPRPESGLSAEAVEARNHDLKEQMKTADPRRKFALVKLLVER